MLRVGNNISNGATLVTRIVDGYYGTLDGEQVVIDLAFYGVGQGFDYFPGGIGAYSGYFALFDVRSQAWFDYINSFKN